MLVLALSDAYIPERSIDLPVKFQKLLAASKNKISKVLLLGNCNSSNEFIKFLETQVCSQIISVKGDSDYSNVHLPHNAILPMGNFKIGLTSGFLVVPKNDILSLLTISRQLDVDILLWGGTHNVEAYVLENKLFINPGSCTGAFNSDWVIDSEEEDGDEEEEEGEEEDADADGESAGGSQVLEEQLGELKISDETRIEKTTTKEEEEEEVQGTDVGNTPEDAAAAAVDSSGKPTSIENTTDKETQKEDTQDGNDESGDTQDNNNNNNNDDEIVSSIPSFCLLDIQESMCTVYIYTYIDNEVKVDKVKYEKQDS